MIQVRSYRAEDAPTLWRLFHDTIHSVNAADYSPPQLDAWAPDSMDPNRWQKRMDALRPFIAVDGESIVGYADCQQDGLVDHFFVHQHRQGRGVGSRLMDAVENSARSRDLDCLYANVSITARPFFEHHGFSVDREQTIEIGEQTLRNYRMYRRL